MYRLVSTDSFCFPAELIRKSSDLGKSLYGCAFVFITVLLVNSLLAFLEGESLGLMYLLR